MSGQLIGAGYMGNLWIEGCEERGCQEIIQNWGIHQIVANWRRGFYFDKP